MLVSSYERVSTQRQENEETIENQRMAIKKYIKENGYTLVKEYKDEGWSGTMLARPGLDEMRLDAKKKIWQACIIYDPDRLARKLSYQELVTDELNEIGIEILYVTTPPPKDDGDRLLLGVKGLFAEYERGRIAERFRLGKLRNAKEGKVITSQASFGYDYVPKVGDIHGHYKINIKAAAIVKMIFEWVGEQGLTIRQVIQRLKDLGIPPQKSARRVWSSSTLSTLLRNETYIGKAHFNRSVAVVPVNPLKIVKYKKIKKTSRKLKPESEWIEIPVQPIISKELFNKVQKQLKTNFERCDRNKKNDYLLGTLIYCPCGRRRAGEGPQRGKHLYYRCSDRVYSYPLPPKCHEKGINARVADKMVWDQLVKLMTSPKLMRQQIERWKGKKEIKVLDNSGTIAELQEEVEKIKTVESRYIKAFGSGVINMEQLQKETDDLKIKRAAIERQIGILQGESKKTDIIVTPNEQQLHEFSEAAKLRLKNLNFEAKRKIVLKVIDSVVGNQKSLTVRGYLSLEEVQNVKYTSEYRDCWATQCREIDAF